MVSEYLTGYVRRCTPRESYLKDGGRTKERAPKLLSYSGISRGTILVVKPVMTLQDEQPLVGPLEYLEDFLLVP